MRTNRIIITLGLATLVTAGASSCGKKVQTATAKEEIVTVQTSPVDMAQMAATLRVTGSLEGIREANVASETQGRVLSITRTMGDRVASGTPLVQVDNELKAIGVHQAEAQRLAAEAALEKAKIDYNRTEQLFKDNAVTKNQVELAQLQVKSAEAALKGAQTGESLAKRQLADATIKAPINGVISGRYVNQGEMVAPGARIVTIVDDSKMKLKINVGESDVMQLKTGEKVNVTVDALPGEKLEGVISNISSKADMARSFAVEVEIANNTHALKSGMFARAEIQRESLHEVPAVPNEALIISGTKTQVYVVENGQAHLRAVKAGTATPQRVEILEGLKPGEEVVTFGQSQLHDGVKVKK